MDEHTTVYIDRYGTAHTTWECDRYTEGTFVVPAAAAATNGHPFCADCEVPA